LAIALVVATPPVRRRAVVEVRVDHELSLVDASGVEIVVRLLEKSGKKARLLLVLPDGVRITPNSF
jgi:hypothetical protein